MSEGSERAVKCFGEGFSCAQAVFASRCEDFGLDRETAYRVAGGFGGGMGHIGEVCGAVSGALMLLGLKYGKRAAGDDGAKERTYAAVKEYTDRFKELHGSIRCTDLLGFDISDEEQLLKAREAGVFKDICPLLVRSSVELVEKNL